MPNSGGSLEMRIIHNYFPAILDSNVCLYSLHCDNKTDQKVILEIN